MKLRGVTLKGNTVHLQIDDRDYPQAAYAAGVAARQFLRYLAMETGEIPRLGGREFFLGQAKPSHFFSQVKALSESTLHAVILDAELTE